MGSARFTYNKCIEAIKKEAFPVNTTLLRQRFVSLTMRKRIKMKKDMYEGKRTFDVGAFVNAHAWLKRTPQCIRDNAVCDVVKAKESNEAKSKKNSAHRWSYHYKKRTDATSWTIAISAKSFRNVKVTKRPEERLHWEDGRYTHQHRRMWTRITMFPSFDLGELWLNEPVKGGAITKDCRLTRDALGHFYLCVPFTIDDPPMMEHESRRRVVALDPGVRKFQTYYSPTCAGQYASGKGGFAKIFEECVKLDAAVTLDRMKPTTASIRHDTHARVSRIRARIRNLVDEVHKKVALDLVRRFDTIVIPVFETQKMVKRVQPDGQRRKIRSKTARMMLTWAHYRFRMRLISKAIEHGKEVVVCEERYTSKCCGNCGRLNDVGSSETYTCSFCGIVLDRDENAARNIFLKHVVAS